MPNITDEQKSLIYSTLKLYAITLNIAFGVRNRSIVSSKADELYVFYELRDVLQNYTKETFRVLNVRMPRKMFPETLSSMTEAQYGVLQTGFAPIKNAAKEYKVHGSPISDDVEQFMIYAEAILSGSDIPIKKLLSQSTITQYDNERSCFMINDTEICFKVMGQEDYFNKVVFSYPVKTPIDWEDVNREIGERFGQAERFNSWDKMVQAMYRINRHIKEVIGTDENFYTQKERQIKRNF